MGSQAGDAAEVEPAREKFLPVESVDAVRSVDEDILRPGVLDSWRRSQVLQVHPEPGRAALRARTQ